MLELLETIRLDVSDYCINLDPHLERLNKSAIELGFDFDKDQCAKELMDFIALNPQPAGLYKVKITLAKASKPQYSLEPYNRFQDPNYIIKLKLLAPSRYHCCSDNPLTKHKTNLRGDFSDELKDCDEVIWLNERGEIAEGSYTNIFWQDQNDQWHTPALGAGILAGTMRAQILSSLRDTQCRSNPKATPQGSFRFAQDDEPLAMTSIKEGYYQSDSLTTAKKIIITNAMLGPKVAKLINP